MSTERAIAEAFEGWHNEVVTAGKHDVGLWVAVTLTGDTVDGLDGVRVDVTLNDEYGDVERHTDWAADDSVEEITAVLEMCAIDFGHWTPAQVESSIGTNR